MTNVRGTAISFTQIVQTRCIKFGWIIQRMTVVCKLEENLIHKWFPIYRKEILPVTQLFELSIFLRIKASSKLNVWNSSSTSRSKCGFTSTWPTTPKSLTKPNGVQTKNGNEIIVDESVDFSNITWSLGNKTMKKLNKTCYRLKDSTR